MSGWIAIDADGHVIEGDELFAEYLEPKFRDRGMGWAMNEHGARRFFADGVGHPPFPKEISIRKSMTAENRIKVLDQERIAAAVLFPSAALALICGGVCEKFPRLKIGFFEAGCSWAPYWLARLDDHFEHRILGRYFPIKLKPSEYFARQCAVTCDPHDDTIALAVEGLGAGKIMFATDYPHFDSGGNAVGKFLGVPGIAAADQRRILADNALEFFGLKVPVLAA